MDKLAILQTRRKKISQKIERMRKEFVRSGDKWKDDATRELWEKLNKRFDRSEIQITALRKVLALHTESRNEEGDEFPTNRMPGQEDVDPNLGNDIDGKGGNRNQPRHRQTGRHVFKDERTGKLCRTYGPGDCLAQRKQGDPNISLGNCLRAMLLNRLDDLTSHEQRAMIGGLDSTGGYLLTPAMSLSLVDLARSASVCIRAGAQTLPMNSAEMNIVRVTSDPTATWRPELVAVAGSMPAFDRIWLRARTVAAIIPISIEMLEDATNIVQVLEMVLRGALGLALDKAALVGAGNAQEPRGIANNTSVNAVTAVGTPTDYGKYVSGVGEVLKQNFPGDPKDLSWIANPRDSIILEKLKDSTGQPLQPPPWVQSLTRLHTTSLRTTLGAGAESEAIIGDFSQLLFAMRTSGIQIRILDAGTIVDSDGTTFNAASQLGKLVVAYMRADVAPVRPTWFSYLSGITIT